jgi:hypothetical protein
MRNSITIGNLDIFSNQRINKQLNSGTTSIELVKNHPVVNIFSPEDCENFSKYIDLIGLEKDSNMVILSSLHHYYYDEEEMTNVQTVVNLKELNQIKQLKNFLHSVFNILSPECNFIGCFVNNKKQNGFVLSNDPSDFYYKRNSDAIENGIASSSPLLNMIYSMIDSRANKYLSERSVSILLEEHGFKVLDMTEIDGLTYFCAQSQKAAIN